ncbi:HutD-domain-containing protein [Blyttiomyces helicus]|uniref:HutD-domain-containing protein n=1 Tax=Blyttiomyces helicus TaxID=388810 RepID=A0A4P9WGN4_9FUNG|nr:HutD-domain-containing protein [Blyttiomyces helicus]|eukprot:RKO89656.1 HutD-domain-containing protein [Blyttiomyces helicus]
MVPKDPSQQDASFTSDASSSTDAQVYASPFLQPDTSIEQNQGLPPLSPLGPAMQSSVHEIPRIQVIDSKDYIRMPWKNGLGTTHQIAIHPSARDCHKDEFIWRLSVSDLTDSCSFSVFPGYDVALLLLAEGGAAPPAHHHTTHTRAVPLTAPASLHHDDHASPVSLKPLVPYTYAGERPTTCRVKSGPLRQVTFIANRNRANVSVNLETVCPSGLSEDGECSAAERVVPEAAGVADAVDGPDPLPAAAPPKTEASNKILLANFTIAFVVAGTVKIAVGGHAEPKVVGMGQTMICERDDEFVLMGPHSRSMLLVTPLKVTPVRRLWRLRELVFFFFHTHLPTYSNPIPGTNPAPALKPDHEDATVLIMQLSLIEPDRRSSLSDPYAPLRPRGRAGSIIIYDDQPMSLPNLYDPSSTTGTEPTPNALSLPLKQWDSARNYRPPVFSARFQNESDVPPPVVRDNLVIDEFPIGKISTVWMNMVKQGLSEWIRVPVIVARGMQEG